MSFTWPIDISINRILRIVKVNGEQLFSRVFILSGSCYAQQVYRAVVAQCGRNLADVDLGRALWANLVQSWDTSEVWEVSSVDFDVDVLRG